jgi:hypothetical protein
VEERDVDSSRNFHDRSFQSHSSWQMALFNAGQMMLAARRSRSLSCTTLERLVADNEGHRNGADEQLLYSLRSKATPQEELTRHIADTARLDRAISPRKRWAKQQLYPLSGSVDQFVLWSGHRWSLLISKCTNSCPKLRRGGCLPEDLSQPQHAVFMCQSV